MERTPVTSSQLVGIGYDPSTQTLELEFPKGKTQPQGSVYQYTNVPQETWDALRAAESKGSYFIRNIKGKFDYRKVS